MPEMTERQASAWPSAVAVLNRAIESDAVSTDHLGYHWALIWADESRPGRGHDLDARWNDGEHFAQITMDVYGYYSTSIASLDWIHTPDEECDCPSCEADREEDERESSDSGRTDA